MSENFEPITTALDKKADEFRRGQPSAAHAEAAQRRGLNLEPGSGDDGWETPPPVDLEDGTRLQLFKDGEALKAAYDAVAAAKQRVFAEVYIWPSDDTGRAFAELLAKKAGEGVAVYAIYDGLGSAFAERAMFEQMRRGGVRLIEFHPLLPWQSRYSWRPGNRDHRKLLVVDDQIAGVAGLNLGNRYAGSWVAKVAKLDASTLWRDAGVGIVGPGAATFSRAFIRTWNYCLHRGPIRETLWFDGIDAGRAAKGSRVGKAFQLKPGERPRPVPGHFPEDTLDAGRQLACMAGAPTLSSPLRPFLYQLIRDARKSLSLTIAYFAPDDEMIRLLCAAAERGVRVRFMFAGKSDVMALVWAARSFYQRLMDAGCEVYEREHVLLHQKSIVVDANLGILGSTNLDYRSIEFNLELSAVVRSPRFARQLEDLFDHDIGYARKIDPVAWREQKWRDRAIMWLVNRMRYVL